MRAGLIDEYVLVTAPALLGRRHAVLHGPGQLGEPEPGGDADVSRRRGTDPIRDEALSTGQMLGS
jgi:riboflavin biosynthesis pyrimidine reductase